MSAEKEPVEQDDKDVRATEDMFSIVWVKMEVDEDGVVEGIDDQASEENQSEQQDQKRATTPVKRHRRKPTTPRKTDAPKVKHLSCDSCDYKTSYKTSLKYHVMNHTNPKPLACEHCDYTTKYEVSMKRHVLGQHKAKDPNSKGIPLFKCKLCDYSTMFKGNLVAHQRKHSTEKKFKCDHCEFSTAYRHSFLKHSNTHKPKDPVVYQCDKCPFITKYEGHISRHLAQIHKEVSAKASKCDHCEFTTHVRWRLNVHKNRMRQDNPIKCVFCDFVTDYHCAFKKHRVEHLGKETKVLRDTDIYTVNKDYQPPRKKSQDEALEQPNSPPAFSEYGRKLYILDKDNEEIDWRSIEVAEQPGELKPFKCIQCDYEARFKASVQRHFQRHHTSKNNRPYKCVNCDFSTKTKDQILLHTKRSKSHMLLQCKTCDFTTYFKCTNVMHQKVHYPFKCTLCDYMCRQSFDMHRHHATAHLGEGLQCRYCQFKATRKATLINHEFIHTGVKPFKCGHCDYSAVRRSLLDNHIKKNHWGRHSEPLIIDDNKIESLKRIDNSSRELQAQLVESLKKIENTPRDILQAQLVESLNKMENTPKDILQTQIATQSNMHDLHNSAPRHIMLETQIECVSKNDSQDLYEMESQQDNFSMH